MVERSRQEMLRKIQEADFYAFDLQLYLNTHPDCERALNLYTQTVREAYELRKKYEEKYGPLTAMATPNKLPWQWSKNPWSWEKERN